MDDKAKVKFLNKLYLVWTKNSHMSFCELVARLTGGQRGIYVKCAYYDGRAQEVDVDDRVPMHVIDDVEFEKALDAYIR